ncbi:MAG: thioredoxin family protein, partial [Gemmatimonadota bacterium]
QSPGFVVFLAALVFVLALSLFGVVTVRLPGAGGSFGSLGEGEGLAASFWNGVLATILATPCTAPFLGAALGFAFTQSTPVTVAVFATTGAGMALPYLLLALRPGWRRLVPRPGPWMERFKQLMAFPLMGTVLWLLWVLGRQLGLEAVVYTGAFLLALALSCWLVGQWLDLRSSGRRRAVVWALAIAVAGATYAVAVHPVLWTAAELDGRPAAATGDPGALEWEPFSVSRVEALLASGRPVFIDFTAAWCWTCKVNEATVLADPRVVERLRAHGVALVKADWTSRNPEITALLRAFGRSGVPLYVIFPPGRADAPMVLPEVITPGMVLERLEQAMAAGAT